MIPQTATEGGARGQINQVFQNLQLWFWGQTRHQEDKTATEGRKKKKGFQCKFAYLPSLKQFCPHNSKYWLGSVGCAAPTTSRCTRVEGSKLNYRILIWLARRRKSCGTERALSSTLVGVIVSHVHQPVVTLQMSQWCCFFLFFSFFFRLRYVKSHR